MRKTIALLIILCIVFTVSCGNNTADATTGETTAETVATATEPIATTAEATELTKEAITEAKTEATTEATTRAEISIKPDTEYSHDELMSFVEAAEAFYSDVTLYEDMESTVVRIMCGDYDDTYTFNTTVKMNYTDEDFRLYTSALYDYGKLGAFEYKSYYNDGVYYSESPEGKYRTAATPDEVIDAFFITGDDFASMYGIDVKGFQTADIMQDDNGNYIIYLMNIDADQLDNLDAKSYLTIASWYGGDESTAEVTEIYMRYTMTADGTFIRSTLGAVYELENTVLGGTMEMNYEHAIELVALGDDVSIDTPDNTDGYNAVANITKLKNIINGEE